MIIAGVPTQSKARSLRRSAPAFHNRVATARCGYQQGITEDGVTMIDFCGIAGTIPSLGNRAMAFVSEDPVAKKLFEAFDARVKMHDDCVFTREHHEGQAALHKQQADHAEHDRIVHYQELLKFQSVGLAMGYNLFEMLERNRPDSAPDLQVEENSPPFSVKDFVLGEAKRAYPDSIKAAQVREALKAVGHEVHEKTVGMTLYRLSKRGLVRREGNEWFYVKEPMQVIEHEDDATDAA